MERSMGWRPAGRGDPVGMYDYLTTLGTAGAHGGDFTYRSADTDMLGWVLERASGIRMADLVSSLLWVPMGAEHDADITCDPVGSAIHDGGISAAARDLARFGQLLLDDGFVDGHEVVPHPGWPSSRHPPPDVRQAFANTDNERCSRAAGTATSSGSCPAPTATLWCASASTARWSTSTGPRGRSA